MLADPTVQFLQSKYPVSLVKTQTMYSHKMLSIALHVSCNRNLINIKYSTYPPVANVEGVDLIVENMGVMPNTDVAIGKQSAKKYSSFWITNPLRPQISTRKITGNFHWLYYQMTISSYLVSSFYLLHPDNKDPRIDIDEISIQRKSFGSMSKRCRFNNICSLSIRFIRMSFNYKWIALWKITKLIDVSRRSHSYLSLSFAFSLPLISPSLSASSPLSFCLSLCFLSPCSVH